MSHKVEIDNLLTASRVRDNEVRQVRNSFQDAIHLVDEFHTFINQTCDPVSSEVIVQREGFLTKLLAIQSALETAKSAAANLATEWVDFDNIWSSDKALTTDLTDAPEEEEHHETPAGTSPPPEESSEHPAEDAVPETEPVTEVEPVSGE